MLREEIRNCIKDGVYIDDGYTGTNFDRPGIRQLLEAVKDARLNCIIVKDFSRFARDYIELGSYIEQIFPFMGIRFISVNDHYDSVRTMEQTDGLDINFRNLLYDLYSKDLSQKVRTSLSVRKAEEGYVSANAPFGYRKAPEDRHMLLIEPEEAEIVRYIFALAGEGMTSVQIAKRLNAEMVRTPLAFRLERGETTRKPKGGIFLWNASFICQILRNPVYIGDIQYGKYEREAVGGRNRLKPHGEWKVMHNHHAALVDRRLFEEVCNGRADFSNGRHTGGVHRHLLTGVLVCDGCKRNLRYHSGFRPYFYCCQSRQGGTGDCVQRVGSDEMKAGVLLCLEKHLRERDNWNSCIQEYKEEIEEQRREKQTERNRLEKEWFRRRQEHIRNYQRYKEGRTETFLSQTEQIRSLEADFTKAEEAVYCLDQRLAELNRLAGLQEREEEQGGRELTGELRHLLLAKAFHRYIRHVYVLNERDFRIEWISEPDVLHLPDRRGD